MTSNYIFRKKEGVTLKKVYYTKVDTHKNLYFLGMLNTLILPPT